MDIILLIARLFLAIIFGVAGVAKLLDPAGTRRAVTGFGVPEKLAFLFSRGLPVIEILIAIALIPLNTAWWGAIASLALLAVFSAAIAVKIAKGETPDCHCFGQIHSEPVGWPTLFRNLAFMLVSGFIVVFGISGAGLNALGWLTNMTAGDIVNLLSSLALTALLVAVLVTLSRLLKSQTAMIEKLEAIRAAINLDQEMPPAERNDVVMPREGLPIGAKAPGFDLPSLDGGQTSLAEMLDHGRPVLLVFVSPNCSGCKALMPVMRLWQRDFTDKIGVAIITRGTVEENRAGMARYDVDQLLIDEDSKVSDDYQSQWTPASVLIDASGRIGSHLVYGDNAIREFFRQVTASAGQNGDYSQVSQITLRYPAWKIGEQAPHFSLPNLDNRVVSSNDLIGKQVALIFWDPECRFCEDLTEDILSLENNPRIDTPKLIFISSGKIDDVMESNSRFSSTTLIDAEFDTGPLFGAQSTPSAILIDGEWKIASSLAVGASNIRALLGSAPTR